MRIGHLSDTHIDYASGSSFTASGVNMRVQDGFDALTETVTAMIAAEVDLVLHSGDLFHKSTPSVAGIVHVRNQLLRLHKAGIPLLGITGNHDWPNTAFRKAATLAVSDPDRQLAFIDAPYTRIRFGDVVVHALSHGGLVPTLTRPQPTPGEYNLLLTHGAADIPGYSQFTCEDSPAEAWVPHDLLSDEWSMTLMGHYHRQHRLPLEYPAWYAGSALRRGFSDEPGDRGWLLIDTCAGTVTPHTIWQRPQFDLPVVDAAGLTGDEVFERVRANLASVDTAGAIVRQQVTNCSSAVRKSMPVDQLPVEQAASWALRITRPQPESRKATETDEGADSPRHTSIDAAWTGFVESDGSVLDADRPTVNAEGLRILSEHKGGSPS